MADGIVLGRRLVQDGGDAWVEAEEFSVPVEIATQAVAILGARGAGKSNAAIVVAEGLYEAGVPWIAVDPKGDWWGIKSNADGSDVGLAVVILGGLHGDVPIAADEGAQWADVLFDNDLTAVVDVSDFSKNERGRFLVAFLDRLYKRHRQDPRVRTMIFEEAHEIIPQTVGREDGRLKEAASRIVLLGRAFGLGAVLPSQRSARLHKDVLTQIGTLVPMRTNGPHDRKAIEAWVVEHEFGRDVVASLPGLRDGESWIWSPEFLGVTARIRWRRRATFDSGSTPVVGARRRIGEIRMAEVDLAAIKEQMSASIERAKTDDPKELRRRLAAAEKRIAEFEMWEPPPPVAITVEGVPAEVVDARGALVASMAETVRLATVLSEAIDDAIAFVEPLPVVDVVEKVVERTVAAPKPPPPRPVAIVDASLGKAEREIVAALARLGQSQTRTRVAAQAGYHERSKGFTNALSSLRTRGLLEGSGVLSLTPDGEAVSGMLDVEPITDWLAHWKSNKKVGLAGRKILDALAEAWPDSIDRDELATLCGYHPRTKGYTNALSSLRTLDLINRGNPVRLLDEIGETIRG